MNFFFVCLLLLTVLYLVSGILLMLLQLKFKCDFFFTANTIECNKQ